MALSRDFRKVRYVQVVDIMLLPESNKKITQPGNWPEGALFGRT